MKDQALDQISARAEESGEYSRSCLERQANNMK